MASLDPDEIRTSYSSRVADIQSRKDLSPDGRRRQLAKIFVRASDDMRAARAASEAAQAAREQQLLRRMFGNPNSHDATSVVSFRDAQDRAEGLKTSEAALELLNRARRSGDDLLARAVAMRALDRAIGDPVAGTEWGAVLDTWATDEPGDVDAALTELGGLHRQKNDVGPLVAASVQHSIPRPSELAGVGNVDALAREADATPDEDEAPVPAGGEFFR